MSRPHAWRILRVFLKDCVCFIAPQPNNPSTLPKFWSTLPKTASCSAKVPECQCSKECQCKLRGHSQSIHLPSQEYPGLTRKPPPPIASVLNGAVPDGPLIRGPTPATAAASTSSICGCGATAGGRSARSRFWTPWRRGRRLFARRGAARRTSAGGWPLGTAPLRMRRRGSRRFASCFAPVRAACSRKRQCGFRNNLDALNAPAKITLVRRSLW